MDPLPMAPDSCSLDAEGGAAQAERYRRAGRDAELLESEPLRIAVRLAEEVDTALVDELVAIERDCCPFFEIAWEPAERRLAFSVSRAEDGPALDAIAYALGIPAARRPQKIL
jgi:hypothetical protein